MNNRKKERVEPEKKNTNLVTVNCESALTAKLFLEWLGGRGVKDFNSFMYWKGFDSTRNCMINIDKEKQKVKLYEWF